MKEERSTQLKEMTPHELTEIIFHKEELFILDVRNQSEFQDWRIEGENIDIINIPYFDLLDGIEPALHKTPEEKKVLVVCAKEGSSKFVAKQMLEAGRNNVYYLQGGMRAWSEHLEPIKVGDLSDGGSVYQFVRPGKGCLSYMIISNGEAAVIDAVRTIEVFEQFAKENNVQIKYTIDTHLHADHISGGRRLAEKTGASYWLSPKDATEVTFRYHPLVEGENLTVGNIPIIIQPVHSPGHTIGSTSLIVDQRYLFTGDILFLKSIGRPDLAGKAEEWVNDLRQTLYTLFPTFSDDLVVLPAHFGRISELGEGGKVSARLGELFKTNPGLNIREEVKFRKLVTGNLPPQPNSYLEIRQTNMGKITPSKDEEREMEIGPNRCAVHDQ